MRICLMLVLSAFLSACSLYPDHGEGGFAEHAIELIDPVSYGQPLGPEHGLMFEFELLRRQLDILVLEGAKMCFPATVVKAKQNQNRIARQIDGGLEYDASNDMLIQREILLRLERQLDYVTKANICEPHPLTRHYADNRYEFLEHLHHGEMVHQHPSPALAQAAAKQGKQTADKMALSDIMDLLNADNQFAFDSEEINPKYLGRLAKASHALQHWPEVDIVIHGHADEMGSSASNLKLSQARAEMVQRYLLIFGIDAERISILAKGESEPYVPGTEPHIRLINRRVYIELKGE